MSIFAIINSLYGDYLSCKETSRRIFTLRVNCVYPYKQLFDWSIMECCSLYGSDWHTFVFLSGQSRYKQFILKVQLFIV